MKPTPPSAIGVHSVPPPHTVRTVFAAEASVSRSAFSPVTISAHGVTMLGAAAMRIAIAPMGKSCTQPSIALDSTVPGMGASSGASGPMTAG